MNKGKGRRGSTREERLQILLSTEELTIVDDFRFQHRMPSRAAAVRELFRLGLLAAGDAIATAGIKSSEYSVLKEPARATNSR
jgi:hypothetical protein